MLEQYAERICGPITESNAYSIGSEITTYFSRFKGNAQLDVGEFDRFIGALGFAFSKCSEISSNWKLEWASLSECDLLDGADCLVNENHSLLVYPIGIIRSDFLKNSRKSESFFKALTAGELPSGVEGSLKEFIL